MSALIFALVGAAVGYGASGHDATWSAIGAIGGFLTGGLLLGGKS